MLGAATEATLIAVLVFGAIAGSAFAAKGGNNSTGSAKTTFTGPVMVTDANGNGLPNYMDGITFNVATTASSYPEVGVRCWQGNSWVYDGYVSYFASWLSPSYFTLDSSNWNATLGASCTARLFYYNKRGVEQVLGTITFAVAP